MEIRKPMSGTAGAITVAVGALVMFWIGSTPGASEALARYGISVRSAEVTGVPGSEALGLRRQLLTESYGAGASDLVKRRFLARRGQVLVLDYEVAVIGGFLRVSVDRVPFFSDEVWGIRLDADRHETVRLTIDRTGIYQLSMTRFRHAGVARLEWHLENP
jgi:hypothetical protein